MSHIFTGMELPRKKRYMFLKTRAKTALAEKERGSRLVKRPRGGI